MNINVCREVLTGSGLSRDQKEVGEEPCRYQRERVFWEEGKSTGKVSEVGTCLLCLVKQRGGEARGARTEI